MNKKKLIAYSYTNNLKNMTEEDVLALDSIHIAFGVINKGKLFWKVGSAEKDIQRIRQIHPDIQIVLSIGGWGADGFSQLAETKEGRTKWIASVMEGTKRYLFDGIDIDWEYPGIDQAGIRAIPEDGENFVLLLQELREALNTFTDYKTLSIAAGALQSYLNAVPVGKYVPYLDYVQLMTYDFLTVFDPVTGHHANLYAYGEGTASGDNSVRMFVEAGVPQDMLIMGGAFYGREWTGVSQSTPGNAGHGRNKGYSYHEIQEILSSGKGNYRKIWDEQAQAAYLYNGKSFITYEDEKALALKAEYVKEHNMQGMMYWEYGDDKNHVLTQHLRRCLDTN